MASEAFARRLQDPEMIDSAHVVSRVALKWEL